MYIKIKITKLSEPENALHKNNIKVGFERIFEVSNDLFQEPRVGECFYLNGFRSSTVQEILSENTFRTHNSIYKWGKTNPSNAGNN